MASDNKAGCAATSVTSSNPINKKNKRNEQKKKQPRKSKDKYVYWSPNGQDNGKDDDDEYAGVLTFKNVHDIIIQLPGCTPMAQMEDSIKSSDGKS